MNWEYFISEKIRKGGSNKNISAPIVRISIIAIALGLAVMILTMGIVSGFKTEIRNKIANFSSHIIVSTLTTGESSEESPIELSDLQIDAIKKIPEVASVQLTASIGAILKSEEGVQGVLMKGVEEGYQADFLKKHLIAGRLPACPDSTPSKEILISSALARQLKLKTGMSLTAYFIQQQTRIRKFEIAGIFENSLESYNQLIYCDLRQIRQLKNWTNTQSGSMEIFLNNFDDLQSAFKPVNDLLAYQFLPDGSRLAVQPVTEKFSMLFSWLSLFDTNTLVIIILMILVALINMSSGLLILILEKSSLIGLLKSMGAPSGRIRRIFLFQSLHFIIKGLLFGNLIGIGIAWIQQATGLFSLNPDTYYIDVVPVQLNWPDILLLNAGTGLLIWICMILPASYVSRIEPDKVLKIS